MTFAVIVIAPNMPTMTYGPFDTDQKATEFATRTKRAAQKNNVQARVSVTSLIPPPSKGPAA